MLTTTDILNLSLAFGAVIISLFLCVFLFYLITILIDIRKAVAAARSVIESIEDFILQPMAILGSILSTVTAVKDFFPKKESSTRSPESPKKKKRR